MIDRLRYTLLLNLKAISRLFYRFEVRWLTPMPEAPWSDLRVISILNHTSLFEWLFAGSVPNHLLLRVATRGLVPAARETVERPLIGCFLKILAPHFIPISREPDHTWKAVLQRIDPDSMVIILPEGRMKRANGLDKHGRPMTVRGGIADILRAISGGKMLIAYSGGLHHVQVPGQLLPKPFKTLRVAFEMVEVDDYKRELGAEDSQGFKLRVKADLERRRDLHCSELAAGRP